MTNWADSSDLEERAVPIGEVVRLWGAVDYKADIRFFDRMYTVAHSLVKPFPHWRTDRVSVNLHDDTRHKSLMLASKRCSFEAVKPENVADTFKELSSHLRFVLDELHVSHVTRMGLKLVVYADLGLTFEELVNQIRPYCLHEEQKLRDLTSPDIFDLVLAFDYKWDNKVGMLRVGSMKSEQGRQQLNNVGNLSSLFPSPEESDELSKFYAAVPESFLFFDIDVSATGDHAVDEWPGFVNSVIPHTIKVFEGTKSLILEQS